MSTVKISLQPKYLPTLPPAPIFTTAISFRKNKIFIDAYPSSSFSSAKTVWTWPTTTRKTTTTRTTTKTTTTTEATVRTLPSTTPQYIHFYERPQISDLPEQPDFYHVYNNEVSKSEFVTAMLNADDESDN